MPTTSRTYDPAARITDYLREAWRICQANEQLPRDPRAKQMALQDAVADLIAQEAIDHEGSTEPAEVEDTVRRAGLSVTERFCRWLDEKRRPTRHDRAPLRPMTGIRITEERRACIVPAPAEAR